MMEGNAGQIDPRYLKEAAMKRQFEEQAKAAACVSQRYTDAPPHPVQTLPSVIGQINDRISQIRERQELASQALNRLVNPRPANATLGSEKAKTGREPVTVEDYMHEIVRALDYVLQTAIDQADALNAAV